MMYTAVKFVVDELNVFLRQKFMTDSDAVLLDRIQEPDGSISPNIIDKVVVSLVNAQRTTVQGHAPESASPTGGSARVHSSPLYLNLSILVSASFIDYAEALKHLSATAVFFQSRKDMTRTSLYDLPAGIEKLDLQLESTTTQELSNLWGMMGGRHYPCLLYKLRMITIDGHSLIHEVPDITKPGVGVGI